MSTVGERIRREREAQGVSRRDLEKLSGVGYSLLSELERGGMKTTTHLRKIADALGVDLAYLETGRGAKHGPPADESDWGDVRGIRQAAALGDGSFPDEYAESHKLKFRSSSLRRKGLREKNLVVYYGDGDSMQPRIHHGDALLFDTSDKRPVDGDIYLFSSADTGLTVKRLVDYGGRWFLKADNEIDPKWMKPVPMDGRHPYTIEGKLRWIGSWEG